MQPLLPDYRDHYRHIAIGVLMIQRNFELIWQTCVLRNFDEH